MEIEDILSKWGIEDIYENEVFEYLTLVQPDKCFYIDRFPKLISNYDKYEQEELYYDKVLNGETSEKFFINEEIKFINIIKKLWLYNNVKVETNFKELEISSIKKALHLKYYDTIDLLKNEVNTCNKQLFQLNDSTYLHVLVKLANREKVYSKFIFTDYEILIVAYGMCFQVYLNDLTKLEILKQIVCTEGLYLREYDQCIRTY